MPYRPDVPQLPPLLRLPRDEIVIEPYTATHLSVAIYTRLGSLYRQKVALLDLPNDLIGIEDLECAGVLHVYVAAVEKLIDGAAAMPGDLTLGVAELCDVRP